MRSQIQFIPFPLTLSVFCLALSSMSPLWGDSTYHFPWLCLYSVSLCRQCLHFEVTVPTISPDFVCILSRSVVNVSTLRWQFLPFPPTLSVFCLALSSMSPLWGDSSYHFPWLCLYSVSLCRQCLHFEVTVLTISPDFVCILSRSVVNVSTLRWQFLPFPLTLSVFCLALSSMSPLWPSAQQSVYSGDALQNSLTKYDKM